MYVSSVVCTGARCASGRLAYRGQVSTAGARSCEYVVACVRTYSWRVTEQLHPLQSFAEGAFSGRERERVFIAWALLIAVKNVCFGAVAPPLAFRAALCCAPPCVGWCCALSQCVAVGGAVLCCVIDGAVLCCRVL